MKVHKFGGASIGTAAGIQNTRNIIQSCMDDKLVIVVSAIGKTTDALEKVAVAFYDGKKELALQLFGAIKQHHLTIAKYLLVATYNETHDQLANFFTEVEWLLYDKPVRAFDYYYDQVVCVGELLSTAILSAYLRETGLANQWLDVRDIIRTDDTFRDAAIDWTFTTMAMRQTMEQVSPAAGIIVTQGFIGATDQNESTTLGREGSDYTAAVFANMLDGESVTIWKDVVGVMSADPKLFPEAVYISELNYKEVVGMAYYGAKVIHPKTIRPLQHKGIPLYVKCFIDHTLPGTLIHNTSAKHLPPIITSKENQVLMQLSPVNFSFVEEHAAGQLYQLFEEIKIIPNITQNGAISFFCCLDDQPERIEKLALAASQTFDVQLEKNLRLVTIRHYTNDVLLNFTQNNHILLRQQTLETVHLLMRV